MPVEAQKLTVTTQEHQDFLVMDPLFPRARNINGLFRSVCHSWLCGSQASFWHNLEPPETEPGREGEEGEEEEEDYDE